MKVSLMREGEDDESGEKEGPGMKVNNVGDLPLCFTDTLRKSKLF